MQPRIYTYKITFEEVPYYYYGSKKEKYYNQEYWGSPITNKWCWELYTPKKQILELFDYTDEGYEECRKVENRLIKPVLNDPWCLNENYGGILSLKIRSENGRKGGMIIGNIHKNNKTGVCGRSKEKMSEDGRNGGKIGGKKQGRINYENRLGIFSLNEQQRKEVSKISGKIGGKIGGKIVGNQKWQCTETGFIANPGNLTKYQNKRKIDTSKRIKIQ